MSSCYDDVAIMTFEGNRNMLRASWETLLYCDPIEIASPMKERQGVFAMNISRDSEIASIFRSIIVLFFNLTGEFLTVQFWWKR